MGWWGHEIYESDRSGDFFNQEAYKLVRLITFHLADESMTGWPPQISYSWALAAANILALWCEHVDIHHGMEAHVVRRWREICLARFEADPSWDDTITPEGLDGRTERRKVIKATFDRLEAVAIDDD